MNTLYRITSSREVKNEIRLITLSPITRRLVFEAGQYIYASFVESEMPIESHPFSIISSPLAFDIQLLVKSRGNFTSLVNELPIGTLVKLDGPYGNFTYKKATEHKQLWISAGIGIAPYLSMVTTLKPGQKSVALHYIVRDASSAVALAELRKYEQLLGRETFTITLHESKDNNWKHELPGHIISSCHADHAILACGAADMIDGVKLAAINAGHTGTLMLDGQGVSIPALKYYSA